MGKLVGYDLSLQEAVSRLRLSLHPKYTYLQKAVSRNTLTDGSILVSAFEWNG